MTAVAKNVRTNVSRLKNLGDPAITMFEKGSGKFYEGEIVTLVHAAVPDHGVVAVSTSLLVSLMFFVTSGG